jgi:hypothetical protein
MRGELLARPDREQSGTLFPNVMYPVRQPEQWGEEAVTFPSRNNRI